MKNLIFAAAALAFTLAPAQAETLRLATSADYPPWESVDASGKMIGFDIAVGNAICAEMKADCEWTNQAYDGLLPALVAGQYDIIISAISITEERKQRINFSVAYAQAPASFGSVGKDFGAPADKAGLSAALKGKSVGVQGASIFERLVEAHFPDAEAKIYERADQIIADMKIGRLDAAVMEISAWEEFAGANKNAGLTMFGPQLTYDQYPELGEGIGIGIQKNADDLKQRVDAAIAKLLQDGTIAKLSTEWFGYDVSP